MKRGIGGLVGVAAVAASIFFVVAPASLAAPGDNGNACTNPGNGAPPFCIVIPPPPGPGGAGGGGGGSSSSTASSDLPRGIWCNGLGILTLTGNTPAGVTIAPLNAVDLFVFQGIALEKAGLVAAADWAPGIGAFCPGAPQVAGKTVTLLGTKVNNLGLSLPGDQGAIYTLASVA